MFRADLLGVAAAILIIGSGPVARADQKSDDILTLLHLTHRDTKGLMRVHNRMIAATMERFEARSPNITNAQDAELTAAVHDIVRRYIENEEAQIRSYYYDHLSEQQIKSTIAFLQSPDGKAYLDTSKGLQQSLDASARRKLPGLVQELAKAFKAVIAPGNAVTLPPGSKTL